MSIIIEEKLSNKAREAIDRARHSLATSQIAKALGISTTTLYDITNDRNFIISIKLARKIIARESDLLKASKQWEVTLAKIEKLVAQHKYTMTHKEFADFIGISVITSRYLREGGKPAQKGLIEKLLAKV